jgi:hypothetical protein
MKSDKRMLIITLLLTIFLVNMAAPVSAYSYSGYKWNANYVAYQKDSSVPSSWSSAISASASAWNNAGATFSIQPMITNNKIYCQNDGNTGYVGLAVPTRSGVYNTRYLMYVNSYYPMSTASGGETGKFDVQSIVTHEFGHWLTLWDVYGSANSTKTMFITTYTNDISKRSLDADDIAGIKYIYP